MNSKIVPTCKSSESVYDLFDRMEKIYGVKSRIRKFKLS